jgi:hypothetical protein
MKTLINNKIKQRLSENWGKPSKIDKKRSSRKLRRQRQSTILNELYYRERIFSRKRKKELWEKPGYCPVCLNKLQRTSKGSRHKKICCFCYATYQKKKICEYCHANQIWAGKLGAWCKRCGHQQRNSKYYQKI